MKNIFKRLKSVAYDGVSGKWVCMICPIDPIKGHKKFGSQAEAVNHVRQMHK